MHLLGNVKWVEVGLNWVWVGIGWINGFVNSYRLALFNKFVALNDNHKSHSDHINQCNDTKES